MVTRKIDKDIQIKRIVDYFSKKYTNRIFIKDFWDGDLCAIGLCDNTETYLIYISTFKLPVGRFNVVLENLLDNNENPIEVGEFNNLTLDKLEKTLIEHLRIK